MKAILKFDFAGLNMLLPEWTLLNLFASVIMLVPVAIEFLNLPPVFGRIVEQSARRLRTSVRSNPSGCPSA